MFIIISNYFYSPKTKFKFPNTVRYDLTTTVKNILTKNKKQCYIINSCFNIYIFSLICRHDLTSIIKVCFIHLKHK